MDLKEENSKMLKILESNNLKYDNIKKVIQKSNNSSKLNKKKIKKIKSKNININKNIFLRSLMPDDTLYKKETPIIAIDCEMVLCEDGHSHIARVSIINYNKHTLFDELIKPEKKVTNYLTNITNINQYKLKNCQPLSFYINDIKKILSKKIIIGHTIENDLKCLEIEISKKLIRDISEFSIYKKGNLKTSLKELSEKYLNLNIQISTHSSIEDARATIELYKLYKQEIDQEIKTAYFKKQISLTQSKLEKNN